MDIHLQLTRDFNEGRLRSVVAGEEAAVLHKVAVMTRYGDWILREDDEAMAHVLAVLGRRGARYRFGAPLDVRWMSGGWSSHLEFKGEAFRVRTDFFTRPPRIRDLDRLWKEQEGREVPFVNVTDLADMKMTDRERDYPIIGELARLMPDVSDRFLYSRSARDLIALAAGHPEKARKLAQTRPALAIIGEGREKLEEALDAERRRLMRADERRLAAYARAAEQWRAAWPGVRRSVAGLPLAEAHGIIVEEAEGVLPFEVQRGSDGG